MSKKEELQESMKPYTIEGYHGATLGGLAIQFTNELGTFFVFSITPSLDELAFNKVEGEQEHIKGWELEMEITEEEFKAIMDSIHSFCEVNELGKLSAVCKERQDELRDMSHLELVKYIENLGGN